MIFNNSSFRYCQRSYAFMCSAIVLVCFSFFAHPAQAQSAHCHADELLSEHMHHYEVAHEIEHYKEDMMASLATRSGGAIIELPVVFHIIHRGESIGSGSNLNDDKILEQLDILNRDFSYLNEDKDQIPNEFVNLATDTEFRFCLAQVDESGQATNGIIRHEFGLLTSTNDIENIVKPNTQWDPNKYINIWIVRMPNSSILGYAYLPIPSILGSDIDGIVLSHLKVGIQNATTRGRTLVHEMGHYLGLLHMWGFEESECNEDDQVSDTPSVYAPYYGCPAFPQFTCGTSDMFMNYMDYVDDNCMMMFTKGQKSIMQGVINNQRASLRLNKDAICNNSVSATTVANDEADMQLYPNPCAGIINIDFPSDLEVVAYKIYGMNGVLLQESPLAPQRLETSYQIPTQSLENGAYMVQLETNLGDFITKKFLKIGE